MSRSELNMALDDPTYGLHCENSIPQRVTYAQLFQGSCVHGALLKLLEGQTPNDSFHNVSVKWTALCSPMNQTFQVRNFVYFECVFDANDQKVLIEFKESKQFSLIDHDPNMTRGCVPRGERLRDHALAGIPLIGGQLSDRVRTELDARHV